MDQQAQDFLKNAPAHPMRSQLEPYRDLIRELRRRRYPYRKIAIILRDRFALKISKSAVHDFIKVRSRHPNQPRYELKATQTPSESISCPVNTQPTDNSRTAIYGRIEALKQKARQAETPDPKPKFHYDGEPLRLIDSTDRKE